MAHGIYTRLPLLVGEINPYGADPRYALYPLPPSSAGGRLCTRVLGLRRRSYLERFERQNLCTGKWSARSARDRARWLVESTPARPFVLLGAKVASAFGLAFEPFENARLSAPAGELPFVMLPHPSGRCRLWNEPGSVERAREALHSVGISGLGEV